MLPYGVQQSSRAKFLPTIKAFDHLHFLIERIYQFFRTEFGDRIGIEFRIEI